VIHGQVGRLAAQDTPADAVKSAQPEAVRPAAQKAGHPGFHLARGLVGKGHGQNLVGLRAKGGNQIGNPVSQHPGLPGPRPGQNQDRSRGSGDGTLLLWVKFVE